MIQRVRRFLPRFPFSPLLFFAVAWALGITPLLRDLEWATLDWRTQYRAFVQAPPDGRIAIALFEDDTENNLVSWPPDRSVHGQFNELVSFLEPRVVTWDVILDASREGDGDSAMAVGIQAARERGTQVVVAAATSADPVEVLPAKDGPTQPITQIVGSIDALFGDAHALVPFPHLREVAAYGFADALRTSDGIVREVPMLVRIGEHVYPSLSLQTLLRYLSVPTDQVRATLGEAIVFEAEGREWRIPISAGGRFLINYRYDQRDGKGDFPTYSYRELFLTVSAHHVENTKEGPSPPNLSGKVLFVGQVVTGKADAGPTPRSAYSPLVLVHANIVNNVLAGDFVRRAPDWSIWISAVALTYLATALSARRSLFFMVGLAAIILAGYCAASIWGWIAASIWLPVAWPLLGFGALQFYVIGRRVMTEQRAKREIQGMFGAYVSPEVVDRLIKANEPPKLGGHAKEITAFFSDIEGFSSFSEQLPPDRLVELMNEYLTACTDVVQEEGGTLDKYIGDAIVAMFGAPIEQLDHAYKACVAACRVQNRVAELRTKWQAEGAKWPESVKRTRTRIGLNSGRCIIGNMGSRTRFNYTMMGDDVNLAARMESGAKSWGVYSMCTEATRSACELHGTKRIVFRPLGKIVVKGRNQTVAIYEIVGLSEAIGATTRDCIDLFSQGLEKFYARDWDAALHHFRRSAELEVHSSSRKGSATNPSSIFIGFTERFRAQPPAPDWNGVHVMQDK